MARGLGIPGLAGLLPLVPLCVMVCRCEPLHSSGYGHMADGIRPEPAVQRTACFLGCGDHPAAGDGLPDARRSPAIPGLAHA